MRAILMALVAGGLVGLASDTPPSAQARTITARGGTVVTYDADDQFSRNVNNNTSV
jgi:hypothetical protein